MEINKINNHISGQLKGTEASEHNRQASKVTDANKADSLKDTVSLNNYTAKKSEELFAKIELEKLNQGSFDKLKSYKNKIQAYQAAKAESPEAAANIEIGKMLNNPDVWGDIADAIMKE